MKVRELKGTIEVGTVVKSDIFGQGVVSEVKEVRGRTGNYYTRFTVMWLDQHKTQAWQHENAFEVMHVP